MNIFKAYKFRIYPNKEQKRMIDKTFGCTRFIFNKFLSERKEKYEKYFQYAIDVNIKMKK